MQTDDLPSTTIDTPFAAALSERYLVYALSTITARSLPDVRDGLKPVHRRLLWAMRLLRLDPAGAYKKSARVVGDVIGKYHPHGDQSVYDAMVRLAQDFALRYPLVDGQGNFGNIDGDNAAAYRYTEARLTQVAIDLMDGLDEDAVEYKPTYNGEEQEPALFPGAFPNLLANGAAGIAVGMATNIPPHNAAELLGAAIMLIEQPDATDAQVLEHVKGPDFPTGGLVVDSAAAIAEAYATGRGGIRVRARWHVEDLGRGTWNAIVTEIPYGVQKGKLIEQIATIINEKKLPILADVRDESDSEIRIVIEPRSRTVDATMLMENLCRMSELESRFSLNLNVLDARRTPRVMSLREALAAWVEHQFVVLQRRTSHRLGKLADRLELLGGYIIAYLNLDRVIEIIRTEDEPKPIMMAEFSLTDRQAEAILNMRLRSLRKLEEMELRLEREPITVILSARGWIRAMKGHLDAAQTAELKFKEGDAAFLSFSAQTTDKILLAAENGRFYTLGADMLPGGRGFGEPVRLMIDLDGDVGIVALMPASRAEKLLVAATDGRGFIVRTADTIAETRKGKTVVTPRLGAKLKLVRPVAPGADYVAAIGDNRRLLVFPLAELARGQGVQLQRYRDGGLSDAVTFTFAEGLSWAMGGDSGRTRTETDLTPWRAAQGAAGRMPPNGIPRDNKF